MDKNNSLINNVQENESEVKKLSEINSLLKISPTRVSNWASDF